VQIEKTVENTVELWMKNDRKGYLHIDYFMSILNNEDYVSLFFHKVSFGTLEIIVMFGRLFGEFVGKIKFKFRNSRNVFKFLGSCILMDL
jgi:hypothetical protein